MPSHSFHDQRSTAPWKRSSLLIEKSEPWVQVRDINFLLPRFVCRRTSQGRQVPAPSQWHCQKPQTKSSRSMQSGQREVCRRKGCRVNFNARRPSIVRQSASFELRIPTTPTVPAPSSSSTTTSKHASASTAMILLKTQGLLPLALVLLSVTIVNASSGDRAVEFQGCVLDCTTSQHCDQFEATKALSLRLTGWSCLDDCKYSCMHRITDSAIKASKPVQQYYGKWPFWRLVGMQEPASVLFSLCNLWSHLIGFRQVRRKLSNTHPMKKLYLLWSILSMNAWFWSAIFHTRGKLSAHCHLSDAHLNLKTYQSRRNWTTSQPALQFSMLYIIHLFASSTSTNLQKRG